MDWFSWEIVEDKWNLFTTDMSIYLHQTSNLHASGITKICNINLLLYWVIFPCIWPLSGMYEVYMLNNFNNKVVDI